MPCLVAMLLLSLVLTSRSETNGDAGAFSIPVSDNVICGSVELKQSRMLRFCSREGVIVNLRSSNKEATGIIFTRSEKPQSRVGLKGGDVVFSVTVLSILEQPDGGSKVAEIATLYTKLRAVVNIPLVGDSAKLRLDRVLRGEFGREPASPLALSASSGSGNGICCVTCSPYTLCALQADLGCTKCSAVDLPK